MWEACLLAGLTLGGCSALDGGTYTLYRSSVTQGGEDTRLHVATFDAADGEHYNRANCEQALILFQSQSGVGTKFWCEKGRFRK
jgi:hypothetical protein